MFGEFGFSELIVVLVLVVMLVGVPCGVLLWVIQSMLIRRREREELRARLAALEAQQKAHEKTG